MDPVSLSAPLTAVYCAQTRPAATEAAETAAATAAAAVSGAPQRRNNPAVPPLCGCALGRPSAHQ